MPIKISVIVPTRNRKEQLRKTIEAFMVQTWQNKEIIVVDNASDDGTNLMMANFFPDIKYIKLPDNIDILAINIGIEASSGDIIWRTDDDSYPEYNDTFEKVIQIFTENPDIHIIGTETIQVYPTRHIYSWHRKVVDKSNVPTGGYPTNLFSGNGAAIRRKVYDKIGGFWGYGYEESDFCTKAIVNGFNVRYFPNLAVLHFAESKENRDPSWRWSRVSAQLVRYNWKYFPFWRAIRDFGLIYIFQLIAGIIQGISFIAFLEGIFSMPAVTFRTIREERQVVPKNKIYDITLGTSLGGGITTHYLNALKRKLKI